MACGSSAAFHSASEPLQKTQLTLSATCTWKGFLGTPHRAWNTVWTYDLCLAGRYSKLKQVRLPWSCMTLPKTSNLGMCILKKGTVKCGYCVCGTSIITDAVPRLYARILWVFTHGVLRTNIVDFPRYLPFFENRCCSSTWNEARRCSSSLRCVQ